jgi:soluble lytic murein transglycosylase-like protein
MPATAKQYRIDPRDPHQAADGAARMHADLSERYLGNLSRMLAAYNWGPTNLDRHELKNAPLETRRYIDKVKAQRVACLRSIR